MFSSPLFYKLGTLQKTFELIIFMFAIHSHCKWIDAARRKKQQVFIILLFIHITTIYESEITNYFVPGVPIFFMAINIF